MIIICQFDNVECKFDESVFFFQPSEWTEEPELPIVWAEQDKQKKMWLEKEMDKDLTVVVEYKRVPYCESIIILFTDNYNFPPFISTGLCFDFFEPAEHEFPIYNISPSIEYVVKQIYGVRKYVGVKITWSGGIEEIDNAYTTMIAICNKLIEYENWSEYSKGETVWTEQNKEELPWTEGG